MWQRRKARENEARMKTMGPAEVFEADSKRQKTVRERLRSGEKIMRRAGMDDLLNFNIVPQGLIQ
ncbi:hypothetical protein N7463_004150 [Penicillium fimorum]|uniref:Uncharacterized protein n=1 Tax=Penicillium fimorum TaxID=1882269 RepID=A0A9W9Y2H9_9EURO|nr:hypothetical protein N7463_004150 [Penicillium fimorum]